MLNVRTLSRTVRTLSTLQHTLPRTLSTLPRTLSTLPRTLSTIPRPFLTLSTVKRPFLSSAQTRAISNMAAINVTPSGVSLVDSDLTIKIDGLAQNKPYTLHMYLENSGLKFTSCGHYVSTSEGCIDCVNDASLGGSFDGVERHGLIWSMVQAPGQRPGLRLITRDVTRPYDMELRVYEGHVDLDRCCELRMQSDHHVAQTTFQRTYMAPGVKRTLVRHGRLRGVLFTPPGPGPFPAVLDLFGGVGGLIEFRAALLASHGIMTLHLAYFNYADLQKNLRLLDLGYFEEGVDYLISHPLNSGRSAGIVGVSKGGELVMNMAANFPPWKLGAVVAINGFHYVYATPVTYKGRVIPFSSGDFEECYFTETGALAFDESVRYYKPKEESVFKVENADAKFLLVSSEDDLQIPAECSYSVEKRRRDAGKHCQHLALGKGVGHLVEPCHAPSFTESYQASFKMILAWGGEKKPHARAQEKSWPIIVDFLKRHAGSGGKSDDDKTVSSKL